jgi:hypothetical protein
MTVMDANHNNNCLVIRPCPSQNVNYQHKNARNVIEPQQHVIMPCPSRKVNSHPQHENSVMEVINSNTLSGLARLER